ncbi:hypothetical protein GCM10009733_016090 [Nonomuraea maheshkhaliensis]|uniref:non-reducing end alpha-L-arabinofuranosidase n=1 Tax=Nonomuraea maheshkhaliensis TaxID=419590 RepID=A0ABN2EX61_9ACTN
MLRIALSALLVAGSLGAPPPSPVPSPSSAASALAEPIPEGAVVDQFDGTTLGPDWTVLSPDDSRYRLSDGALRLDTLTGDTHQGTDNARNLFLVDVPDGDFEIVTKLSAPVALDFQSAGLLAWQDWDNYVRAGLAHVGFAGGPVIETATEVGAAFTSAFEAGLARWVRDTLDLIEFANGPVSSTWGRKRAELGHPKPFGLEYLGLGNEEIYPEFFANYPKFADAIRARYPNIKIISNAGQTSQGAWFDRMWQFARDQKADLVDEHYYNNTDWFLSNTRRYDFYDREGPKVFVGEYASRGNTFFNALSEAAYMTGLERNSDVVRLASYAPLLANVDYVDWTPDLIWFDNDQAYGSPSYHVQRLFATNAGERVVPSTFEGEVRPVEDITGGVGLGAWNTAVRYDDVKVTAADGTVLLSEDFSAGAAGWTPGPGTWAVRDGGYEQSAQVEDARATAGSAGWSDYTMEVTARKTAGAEGFLVMFGVRGTGDFYWWNVGGWGNTQSAVEKEVNGGKAQIATSSHTVETGRDYRLKVQVSGRTITTWLDGEKVDEFVDSSRVEPLYQVVSRDGRKVTVKVVNAQDTAVRTRVDLGSARLRPNATVTSLTGSPSDMNSISEPERVAPRRQQVDGFSAAFTYDFPAYSVTFIELTER